MSPLSPTLRAKLAAAAAAMVRDVAGGFLRNAVLDARVCRVCRTPEVGDLCWKCRNDGAAHPGQLADATAFLAYGVNPASGHKLSQAGSIMYGYKSGVTEHLNIVKGLVTHGLLNHSTCPGWLPGSPGHPTRWATVPSRRGRLNHPLREMVAQLAGSSIEAPLQAQSTSNRALSATSFVSTHNQAGQHVLLIEDTWTGGASAQSAAMAFKAAGAARVSTLIVARWIKPDWDQNGSFLDALPDWSNAVCPWTGGTCPPPPA